MKTFTFISYAKEDYDIAKSIFDSLKSNGIELWFDRENLLPGQNWELEISDAIKKSSFFIALLSSNSVSKKGFVQKELKIALDVLSELPSGKIFIIPVRLDSDCTPTEDKINKLHWVDLFDSFEKGINQILQVLRPSFPIKNQAEKKQNYKDQINEELFTILVLGMQNNGKSTLLNAMLCDKVLPARASLSTGVITLLDYGDSDVVEVYEFGKSKPRCLKREEFFEQYTLKANDIFEEARFQNVMYARMETKHRFCDLEVRLVDSPDLSKQLSQQPEITQIFLKAAHAIVLILYAKRLLDKEERYFLKHIGQNRLKHVFFIINIHDHSK